MPINWDELDSKVDAIIKNSGDVTDKKLASEISSITRLTDDEIQELFPKAADAKKLTELMKIVKSAEDRNNKVNQIVSNAEEFGGIILSLLGKFV
jgi:hypothetical protein